MTIPDRAVQLWRHLAGDEAALTGDTVTIVRGSRGICPDGWTGVLRLGRAYVIEAGEASDGSLEVLRGLDDPASPRQVAAVLDPQATLGPGELSYLADTERLAAHTPIDARITAVPQADAIAQLDDVPPGDLDDSALLDMEEVLLADRGGEVLGAAGHVVWPTGVAHIGLLVAPRHRGGGAGTTLAAAATSRALERGLFPQWRAATENHPSRAIARRLGYVEVGRQYSFHLG